MRYVLCLALTFALACGDDAPADPDGGGAMCVTNADCSDGVFCNGSERCAPAESGADGRGCLVGTNPCFEGQECSEEEARCVTVDCSMADLDGDGEDSIDCGGTDCDDGDAERYSSNTEICDADGKDEDCDPMTLGADEDGDGYAPLECCNGSRCGLDCDDDSGGVSPDAVEACNGIDEDCDGDLDEGAREVFYRDLDGDGFGDPATPTERACSEDPLFVRQADDCDDRDPATNPSADEICDGRDNDCNTATPFDQDGDGDGHLSPDAPCTGGDLPLDDCDDANPLTHGDASERCSGLDDDCDGTIDEASANDWCTTLARSGTDTTANALCGADASCVLSACGSGRADCDGTLGNGCETDLANSADHCGACGVTCSSGVCNDGLCAPETGGTTPPNLTTLRADEEGVCALTDDGQALCWGDLLPFEDHARPAPLRGSSGPLTGIVDIGLGEDCLCALMDDGRIRCMGAQDLFDDGLCNGTGASTAFVVEPTPIQEDGGDVTDARALAVSAHHGCFIRPSATVSGTTYTDVVYCWGSSYLGNGTTAGSNTPQLVLGPSGDPLSGVTDIDTGERTTCVVAGGEVLCWGGVDFITTSTSRAGPISREGGGALAADSVTVGYGVGCALNGTDLWCWGNNENSVIDSSRPSTILSDASQIPGAWVEVAPGNREQGPQHICARRADGTVRCWGDDIETAVIGDGLLGNGCEETSCEIVDSVSDSRIQRPVSAIASGERFSCGLVAGWPFCWGRGYAGQLGVASSSYESIEPVPIPDQSPTAQLELGSQISCARSATGVVSCWGDYDYLGLSGNVAEVAYRIGELSPAVDVAVGRSTACVVGTDRQVRCFGGDLAGQGDFGFLGGLSARPPSDAYLIPGLTMVRDLVASDVHACAIREDDTVWCWGESAAGATGAIGVDDCGGVPCHLTPVQVSGLPGTPVELAMGGIQLLDQPGFTCARLADGRVACWGGNDLGTLGDGSRTSSATPVLVAGLNDAVSLTGTGVHVCAKRSSGEAVCWGADLGGTLGTLQRLGGCGFAACSSDALEATSLRGIETLSAGLVRTCASLDTGGVYCWGGGGFTDIPDAGPVPVGPVPGLAFPSAISVGSNGHCALTPDAVRCWGEDGADLPLGRDGVGDLIATPQRAIGL